MNPDFNFKMPPPTEIEAMFHAQQAKLVDQIVQLERIARAADLLETGIWNARDPLDAGTQIDLSARLCNLRAALEPWRKNKK